MANVQAAPITFDEFMNLPDPASGHLELHNGEVVTVPPRTHAHAKLQQSLAEILLPIVKGKGFFTIEFPFRTPGNETWQADLAFVRKERSDISEPWLMGAPDWVIEVLSPSNTVIEMNQKMDVCMANGCDCFWVIDPKRRTVATMKRAEDAAYIVRVFNVMDSVPLPSPLEGAIAVASIFKG